MGCAHGICGSDGLTINGIPSLACQKLVKDYNYESEITIEPLKFFSVIKDLVVEVDPFFERLEQLKTDKDWGKLEKLEIRENIQTVEELNSFEEAIRCILCGCCIAACPITLEEEPDFIGPAALLRSYRYLFDSRDRGGIERMKYLEKPAGIWSCRSHYKCTLVCPKQIKVTKTILKTKRKIRQELHQKDR
jgi:succinate dehydrogenase / fumarate reductase iron-sulfur subunit